MAGFCKSENCPASAEILAFQSGGLCADDAAAIRRHIAVCDFCSAEVEFYSHYPQPEEWVAIAQMPGPLYDLAQALLSAKKFDPIFETLMDETEDSEYEKTVF